MLTFSDSWLLPTFPINHVLSTQEHTSLERLFGPHASTEDTGTSEYH